MNYLKEVLAFQDWVQFNQVSPSQIALWHALMFINNKCGWQEWFTAPNKMLELGACMDKKAIIRARNQLKQMGIIDFRANGNKATSYKIISLPFQNDTAGGTACGTAPGTAGGTTGGTAPGTINKTKQNKTKQNKTLSMGEQAQARFIPPTKREVEKYCHERRNGISAEAFIAHYESKGWLIGKNKMKDWKAAVRTWEQRRKEGTAAQYSERRETLEELRAKIADPLEEIMAQMEE